MELASDPINFGQRDTGSDTNHCIKLECNWHDMKVIILSFFEQIWRPLIEYWESVR